MEIPVVNLVLFKCSILFSQLCKLKAHFVSNFTRNFGEVEVDGLNSLMAQQIDVVHIVEVRDRLDEDPVVDRSLRFGCDAQGFLLLHIAWVNQPVVVFAEQAWLKHQLFNLV